MSKVKRNCARVTERGKEAWSINREPMNKNRIEGVAKQGEWAMNHEALVTKARWRRCGGCAMKVCDPYLGRSRLVSERKTALLEREVSRGRSSCKLGLTLDKWLRHRLRAIQLKHWKRPRAIYRELKALGAKENVARQLAVNSRRWWRNSDRLLKTVLTTAYFDGLGVPRMS